LPYSRFYVDRTNAVRTWEKGEFKGRGGQGDVYLARKVVLDPLGWAERLKNTVAGLNGIANVERNLQRAPDFRELLHEAALQRDAPMGALKIMHRITDPDVAAKARGRMKQELAALAGLDHPAIVKILDSRLEEGWFVMEYFSSGTLETRLGDAAGDTRRALAAFRPLVEATARIHTKGYSHRDIKPANIFVGDAGKLVLGDFGLVIDPLSNEIRQTDTYENVGSRAGCPPGPMGCESTM
jgi:serine/threonine protein kinase